MRTTFLAAAGVCLAVAALAALGALDAWSWRDAASRPDGRPPSALLPGDPVGRVVELEDDLAYRRAVSELAVAERLPTGFDNGERRARALARVVGELGTAAASDDPRLASRANDLLGVLVLRDGALPVALARFEAAVRGDPQNTNAKRNLETVLRALAAVDIRLGPMAGAGPQGRRGAGSSPPGTGY